VIRSPGAWGESSDHAIAAGWAGWLRSRRSTSWALARGARAQSPLPRKRADHVWSVGGSPAGPVRCWMFRLDHHRKASGKAGGRWCRSRRPPCRGRSFTSSGGDSGTVSQPFEPAGASLSGDFPKFAQAGVVGELS